jgi:hypothetical protein
MWDKCIRQHTTMGHRRIMRNINSPQYYIHITNEELFSLSLSLNFSSLLLQTLSSFHIFSLIPFLSVSIPYINSKKTQMGCRSGATHIIPAPYCVEGSLSHDHAVLLGKAPYSVYNFHGIYNKYTHICYTYEVCVNSNTLSNNVITPSFISLSLSLSLSLNLYL